MKLFSFSTLLMLMVGVISFSVLLQWLRKAPARIPLSGQNLATRMPVASPSLPSNSNVELLFLGDIMLDRNIRVKAEQNGYDSLIGPKLDTVLQDVDFGVANLEGPVTSNPSTSVGSAVGSSRNFIFTFAPESIDFLLRHNIRIVNLGNNHILNFGAQGLAETYQLLAQSELKYFGFTGETQPNNTLTYILQTTSGTIGFVNYNQFISGGEQQVFIDIENTKPQVDYLVVYTHWGNEYVPENKVLVDLAHRFVDAGADLVIGSHPHVVTRHEEYKDKHIYYSLGNFIFDQYFDENVKKGLAVKVTINPKTKETIIQEYPLVISQTGETELQ